MPYLNSQVSDRVSVVIVYNSDDLYFVHRRKKTKQVFPGLCGVGIGGKTEPEESHLEAATRELREELGPEGSPEYCFHFVYQSKELSYEGGIFSLLYDGPIRPSPREFESHQWMKAEDILKLGSEGKLCPDTKVFFKRYLDLIS